MPSEPECSSSGQHFQYAMSSTMIHGVGRDAEFIARAVSARAPSRCEADGDLSEERRGRWRVRQRVERKQTGAVISPGANE